MVFGLKSEVARSAHSEPIHVIPTGAALGAEVSGVDLKNIGELQYQALKHAWHEHQVVLVRGQALSDPDLVAFSRRFGNLDFAPVQETGRRFVEGLPEIYIVSNVIVNGEPIGSLGAGLRVNSCRRARFCLFGCAAGNGEPPATSAAAKSPAGPQRNRCG